MYSNRNKPLPDIFIYDRLPNKVRNQILWIWTEVFGTAEIVAFDWVYDAVCEEHGLLDLGRKHGDVSHNALVNYFIRENTPTLDILLDITELSFRRICHLLDDHYLNTNATSDEIVELLNQRFRENGIGYEFVFPPGQLIRLDNTILHQQVLRPALGLLSDPQFSSANNEFLAALDDYKNGAFSDVLTKGGSAFESLMKIIADNKGWQYNQNDTANSLIKTFINNTTLPSFFETPLIGIATLRNKLSSAHGAGTLNRKAEEHYARYFIYQVAAAMLMLCEEAP